MYIPNIDLTDAARAYGLDYVPKVVHTDKDTLYEIFVGDPEAAFSADDKAIHVYDSLLSPVNDYDQSRFASVGIGPLDTRGKIQFILAHELWHARQNETWDPDAFKRQTQLSNLSSGAHDSARIEREADEHAAEVYSTIKIGE